MGATSEGAGVARESGTAAAGLYIGSADPEHARRGLGTLLLETCEKEETSEGAGLKAAPTVERRRGLRHGGKTR